VCDGFDNDGECSESCPELEIYDKAEQKYVANPNAKFKYGSLCVDECPRECVFL